VTTASGTIVDRRSEIRYATRPSALHFFRLRSSPSTFRTTLVRPPRRGRNAAAALIALQTRTASNCSRAASTPESAPWTTVSRYFVGIVGRTRIFAPRHSSRPGCA
jgi:hypothetical protein